MSTFDPSANLGVGEDPYSYTRGKWLVQDDAERQARLLKFDFQALCEQAIACSSGAKRVDRVEKKEGSYNRVFVFYLDNGKKLVGRIPTSAAGPAKFLTNSEVATIAYCKTNIGDASRVLTKRQCSATRPFQYHGS